VSVQQIADLLSYDLAALLTPVRQPFR